MPTKCQDLTENGEQAPRADKKCQKVAHFF